MHPAHPPTQSTPTPEDEAFAELEQLQQARLEEQARARVNQYVQRAQVEAVRFVQDHHGQLGTMTLRRAFELGYRYGYSDALAHSQPPHTPPTEDHGS